MGASEKRSEKFIRRTLLTIGILAVASSTFWVARNTFVSLSNEVAQARYALIHSREEKDTALDLVTAKEREVKQLKVKLQQAIDTLDAKDRIIEKRNRQIEDNRQAAKALGEVISKERDEKEQLRKNIENTIRPHVDKCNKALKDKNDAIEALVTERDSQVREVRKEDEEMERREKEITTLKSQLKAKEGEIMRIQMKHKEIQKENVKQNSHATNIWKATVEDAASSHCPSPLPQISEAVQLGEMLQSEKKRVGVELGFQDTNFTEAVLQRWNTMTSYFIVEPSGPNALIIRNMTASNNRVRLMLHEDLVVSMKEFSPLSVDYLHINFRLLKSREVVQQILRTSWDKLRAGALITGGFPCPGTTTTAQVEAHTILEMKWAVAEFCKEKNRQPSFALETDSMAWIIRR